MWARLFPHLFCHVVAMADAQLSSEAHTITSANRNSYKEAAVVTVEAVEARKQSAELSNASQVTSHFKFSRGVLGR